MILKDSSKPRRTRAELEMSKLEEEKEKGHIAQLKQIEGEYQARRFKLEDGLSALAENEKMIEILKNNGLMDPQGNIKC